MEADTTPNIMYASLYTAYISWSMEICIWDLQATVCMCTDLFQYISEF